MTSRQLSVSDLEAEDNQNAPIWALNDAVASKARQSGEVHIGIPKINGTKLDDLYLAMTWLPVCLTDQIPRAQLMASSEFRNAVNSRVIRLITAEHAELLNNQEGAEEERERIAEREQQIQDATASRSILDSGAEIISMSELAERNKGGASVTAQAQPSGLSDKGAPPVEAGFIMFVENLMSKPDVECLNLIRARNSAKRSEINYMIDKLRSKEKVVAYLRQF